MSCVIFCLRIRGDHVESRDPSWSDPPQAPSFAQTRAPAGRLLTGDLGGPFRSRTSATAVSGPSSLRCIRASELFSVLSLNKHASPNPPRSLLRPNEGSGGQTPNRGPGRPFPLVHVRSRGPCPAHKAKKRPRRECRPDALHSKSIFKLLIQFTITCSNCKKNASAINSQGASRLQSPRRASRTLLLGSETNQ
jgi:hypothetical protein